MCDSIKMLDTAGIKIIVSSSSVQVTRDVYYGPKKINLKK